MIMNPEHANERWRLTPAEAEGVATATCLRPLTIERRMARKRLPAGGWQHITEADIVPVVEAVRNEGGNARVITGSNHRPHCQVGALDTGVFAFVGCERWGRNGARGEWQPR